jgi:hypothetical protein
MCDRDPMSSYSLPVLAHFLPPSARLEVEIPETANCIEGTCRCVIGAQCLLVAFQCSLVHMHFLCLL